MERLQIRIGKFMLIGVLFAASLVLIGGIMYLFHHGLEHVHYGTYMNQAKNLSTYSGIISSAFHLQGEGIIQLGILSLVIVQVIRVGLTGILFAKLEDYRFVFITLFILAILIYSLVARV